MGMTFHDARHLLSRTGFGGTPAEIHSLALHDRQSAVEQILTTIRTAPVTAPPSWIDTPPPPLHHRRAMTAEEKNVFRRERHHQGQDLKAWWFKEMVVTSSPLTERLTLFWHNHFTSSLKKVKWPPLLYRQNLLFRRMGMGSFRDLLFAVAKDPAMILYLDTQTNRKSRPNENFARELFELFTLGEGHYTEQDIKEAARAFTAWKIDRRNGTFRIAHRQEDTGLKTVLGQTGRFTGDDILTLALRQPSAAPYLVTKFWREFISDEPVPDEVHRLAGIFRDSGYQITPLLRALLTSPHFWAPENRGVLIKSPVDLIVGTTRLFALPISTTRLLPRLSRQLGQDVFDPPNVKGWPGGTQWITTTTLLDRWQVLQRALRGHGMHGHRMNGHLHDRNRQGTRSVMGDQAPSWIQDSSLDDLQATLLAFPPVQPIPDEEDRGTIVRHLALDPTYQLK